MNDMADQMEIGMTQWKEDPELKFHRDVIARMEPHDSQETFYSSFMTAFNTQREIESEARVNWRTLRMGLGPSSMQIEPRTATSVSCSTPKYKNVNANSSCGCLPKKIFDFHI